jgi:UDP-GlcNAc3NAcA epimerase
MKIVTVIGARPQFVKAAVVSRAIQDHNARSSGDSVQEVIVHTGQHYDANMSDVFFSEMKIPLPQYHLAVEATRHGAMTGKMLEKIEEVLLKESPDLVLVYGDTNSTLAGSLAAAKLHIPIAHVEAGLRSFDMKMPEEVNRILTDQVAKWLFCPTQTACDNLSNEGFSHRSNISIENVGDVMYDAALFYQKIAKPTDPARQLLETVGDNFYLATVHRAENTDNPDRLLAIMSALEQISQTTPVLLPLHPRTQKILQISDFPHIKFLPPVGYFDMLFFLSNCKGVLTDSGGLQKEAYFFQKPCITLRDETEWVELLNVGTNLLAGADCGKIMLAEKDFFKSDFNFSKSLYGQGDAANIILDSLLKTSPSLLSVN